MAQSYEGRKGNTRLQNEENEVGKWWKGRKQLLSVSFLLGGKIGFEKMNILAAEDCCSKIKPICNSLMQIRKIKK